MAANLASAFPEKAPHFPTYLRTITNASRTTTAAILALAFPEKPTFSHVFEDYYQGQPHL